MSDSQVQEQAPETKVVGKKGKPTSGDLILDVAAEVEGLTKPKALSLAATLAENTEVNQFKLGGVLKRIFENSWFEGFESFDSYVYEKFGFQARKARYLMDIYTGLVDKQIPWEKVSGLGWTKLKDLVDILTLENVDEWVAKASNLTVLELQAALKASTNTGDVAAKTASDSHPMKFMLKSDQLETVQQGLNKAKAEIHTEYDNVALETICAGYLAGTISMPATSEASADPKEILAQMGWEEALKLYSEVFPGVDLAVEAVNGDGTEEAVAA